MGQIWSLLVFQVCNAICTPLSLFSAYEHAVLAAGTDFRSDRLWEAYISWETEQDKQANVTAIYDRLLGIPTQLYSQHFQRYVIKVFKMSDLSATWVNMEDNGTDMIELKSFTFDGVGAFFSLSLSPYAHQGIQNFILQLIAYIQLLPVTLNRIN